MQRAHAAKNDALARQVATMLQELEQQEQGSGRAAAAAPAVE